MFLLFVPGVYILLRNPRFRGISELAADCRAYRAVTVSDGFQRNGGVAAGFACSLRDHLSSRERLDPMALHMDRRRDDGTLRDPQNHRSAADDWEPRLRPHVINSCIYGSVQAVPG